MGDLVFLFHQIQLLLHSRIILVLVLAYLEQYFNHVLHSLVDISFVQDASELIVDCQSNLRVHLFDMLSHFLHQPHSDLNAVVCRLVQQQ